MIISFYITVIFLFTCSEANYYKTESYYCARDIRVPKSVPVETSSYKSQFLQNCGWSGIHVYVVQHYVDYKKRYVTETVYECCPGYKNVSGLCEPTCSNCIGGKCIRPNVCECPSGYVLLKNVYCEPYCSEGCINADCIKPETCHCRKGYTSSNISSVCKPECLVPCKHGYCSQPDECKCYPGFRTNEINKYTCDPICKEPCENASCTAPDVCTCEIGYERLNQWQCRPSCFHGCNGKGHCIKPNICECTEGYDPPNCVPICSQGCTNGNCTKPDICLCEDGYAYLEGVCSPVCTVPCQNGTCVGPDECECDPGFEKNSTNECIPLCYDPCKNGVCTSPDVCSCFDGYLLHPSDPALCLPTLGLKYLTPSSYFLNKYVLKNVVDYNITENSFLISSFPSIDISKNCHSMLNCLNKSIGFNDNMTSFCFICEQEYDFSHENLKLICELNLSNDSCTNDTFSNYNSALPTWDSKNKTDLLLYLIFPEVFSLSEDGECMFYPQDNTRFFSDRESLTLIFFPRTKLIHQLYTSASTPGTSTVFLIVIIISVLFFVIILTVPYIRRQISKLLNFRGVYILNQVVLSELE